MREVIKPGYEVDWDVSWNDCERMFPKLSKFRWCTSCQIYHDAGAFNTHHGRIGMCVASINNQRKIMAKVKGGAGVKK